MDKVLSMVMRKTLEKTSLGQQLTRGGRSRDGRPAIQDRKGGSASVGEGDPISRHRLIFHKNDNIIKSY
jgi:hypothetical protein